MKFTVLGGSGFIGRNLVEHLKKNGHDVSAPSLSNEESIRDNLGHVIYCIGLTGDFRGKLFETIEAHISLLANLIKRCEFDSWLYLSSTRIYRLLNKDAIACEDTAVPVYPSSDGLYDISKLAGEALCLSQQSSAIRVVRLSNVYGSDQSTHTFLAEIIQELKLKGKAIIREAPESSKDYIALTEVLPLLESIALSGRERLYNVASGKAVTHAALAKKIEQLTGMEVLTEDDAPCRIFPQIDISRIRTEFGYVPTLLVDNLSDLIKKSGLLLRGEE
jgi:nucleoside-diphosphate-sugar epimerase